MAGRDHLTRLGRRSGNGQGAGKIVRRAQGQDAQGELVLHEAINGRIERAIATADNDEIQLRPVLLDPCRNVLGMLDRCRDQLKIQIVQAFYRLSQGVRPSPSLAIDEQQCALAHNIPLTKKVYPAVNT